MKHFWIALMVTASSNAWAGHSVGNGGNGIEINGQLHLLDLVEAGVELAPYFQDAVQVDPHYQSVADVAFWKYPEVATLVARKLTELAQQDRLAAAVIARAIEMYAWQWVNIDLVPINDYDGSDLAIASKDLWQLAVRDEKVIRIDQEDWGRMSPGNQAALVFHEAVYAFLPEESRRSREFVGVLFTPHLKKGPAFLRGVLNSYIDVDSRELDLFRSKSELEGKAAGAWPAMEQDGYFLRTAPTAVFGEKLFSGLLAEWTCPFDENVIVAKWCASPALAGTNAIFAWNSALSPFNRLWKMAFSVTANGQTYLEFRSLGAEAEVMGCADQVEGYLACEAAPFPMGALRGPHCGAGLMSVLLAMKEQFR